MRVFPTSAVLALTAALVVGCGNDDTEPTSSGTGSDPAVTSEAPATEPTTAPTEPGEAPSEDPTEPAPDGAAVPVYFVGDTPLGPRLYREFHRAEGDPLQAAAELLVAGDTLDPDYRTLLRGVTVESVVAEDGALVVTLGEDSPLSAPKGTSPKDARLAVQSLVYTLQGVAQTRDPVVVRLADGAPADLYDQPTGRGVRARPELDVLSLVNLTAPEEGTTAASVSLSVEGVASSFEATVPFTVLDEAGTEVLTDFTTAEGWVDKLYPFATEIDVSGLEPGTYTLVARTDDPSGGEGPGPFEDTKTFTVE